MFWRLSSSRFLGRQPAFRPYRLAHNSRQPCAAVAPSRLCWWSERLVYRTTSELSFHCLRHTATSLLKNAGVSDAVARDIIGHDSAAVSAHYTHIDTATKRGAVDSMPDVLAVKGGQKGGRRAPPPPTASGC